MAGNLSDYSKNNLRTAMFRTGAYVKPAGIYIALYTAAPTDAGGGTEVSGGSSARVQVGPSDATWSAHATAGRTQNVGTIAFPTPSANWGTVTHWGAHDASTAGNLLAWGPMTTPRVINNGDLAPTYPASTFDFQWD